MTTRARLVGLVLAAVTLAGCTQSVEGSAVRRALPVSDLPDVAGLVAVDAETFYIRDGNPEYGFGFRTPNGIVCGMGSFPVWEAARVYSDALRPDKGPGVWEVTAERFGPTTVETAGTQGPERPPGAPPTKELPKGHFVVDSVDTPCVVTEDDTPACHVGEHGFILAPDTTTTF